MNNKKMYNVSLSSASWLKIMLSLKGIASGLHCRSADLDNIIEIMDDQLNEQGAL